MRRFGAQYRECFGTNKEQKEFYKNAYYKHLWTWAAFDDDDGRLHMTIVAPQNALKLTTLRGLFNQGLKVVPRERRGGRPRSIALDEVPRLHTELEQACVGYGSLRIALPRIAEQEGVDPRTLKKALGDLSHL